MAKLIRSAKSASDWENSELDAYHITTLDLSASQFFQVPELPPVPIIGDFVEVQKWEDMKDSTDVSLGFQMSLAMGGGDSEASVDLFAIKLLERLGYTTFVRQVVLHKDLPLDICGETRHAQTDVALVAVSREIIEDSTILLVQEDKTAFSGDPVAQLVAEAIAAASRNNRIRMKKGMAPLAKQVIPGITLVGTTPSFYRIPITTSLTEAVKYGEYPAEPTIILRHKPVRTYGMVSLQDRQLALRCYKAFEKFIDAIERDLASQ